MASSALHLLSIALIILYALSSLFILAYSISQAVLLFYYLKRKKKNASKKFIHNDAPDSVLIQLPVFNEKLVIHRLINSVCAIDYPLDKLIIQVLDDSTDETSEIIKELVAEKQALGFTIYHIQRETRTDYKAGALKYGLTLCQAPYVAIFDADFIPPTNFLRSTLPYFIDETIGMVQTRWGHLNQPFSLLTKLQAFALDAHFIIEQNGRNESGSYINFNGTAGIWRRDSIIDAGNWSGDTLTEDLDLSYRAQMKGWKFIYTDDILVPAELPPTLSALKSQQYRWTKGGAECTRKHLWNLLNSDSSRMQKLQGAFHLLNTFVFLCIFLSAVSSVALLRLKILGTISDMFFQVAQSMLISFVLIGAVYYYSIKHQEKRSFSALLRFITTYPFFLSLSMALSLYNSFALLEGYMGHKTPFIRTPKYNAKNKVVLSPNSYHNKSSFKWLLFESAMFCYFVYALIAGLYYRELGLIAYHSMLAIGYALLVYYSLPSLALSASVMKTSASDL